MTVRILKSVVENMKFIIILLLHLLTGYTNAKFSCEINKNVYFIWSDEVGIEALKTCEFGELKERDLNKFMKRSKTHNQEKRDQIEAFWIYKCHGMAQAMITNLATINEDFKKVVDMRIEKTDLLHVSSEVLKGLTNIKRLYLGNNQITQVTPDAFEKLTNLQILFLNKNDISHLSDDSFNQLIHLRKISLSFNSLTEISENLFSENSQLSEIYLRGNQLQIIASSAFERTSLHTLDVRENNCVNLSTFPDIKDLYSLLVEIRENCSKKINIEI